MNSQLKRKDKYREFNININSLVNKKITLKNIKILNHKNMNNK